MNLNETTPDLAASDESAEQRPEERQRLAEQSTEESSSPAPESPAPATTESVESSEPAESAETAESTEAAESVTPDAPAPEATAHTVGGADSEATESEASESGASDSDEDEESTEERVRRLEEEGDIAADYLEELLDIADLDGDIDIDVDGDRASVEIRGADRLAGLNRPKGDLLDALQELSRLAVQTRTGNRSRLMLDIGGFRAEHKTSLEQLAATAIAEAKESGAPVPMRPMNPFERKVVHDVAKQEGLRSESDGDGKNRHVVIYPAS
ncbi:R3H domain-containing nucleic acid-binding protein [Brachybacterium sp. AOP43-C2-M15]|uniref:R3H domain-containing nucleic acid-binding protein n=1 Tax=Brachybacterium sp. AOP43-C2-M15 TaxID=3457661 RepID=UPI0040348618